MVFRYMDCEADDIFLSDCDYQFRSLTTCNFIRIISEIISNENIDDGAAVCFQVFYRIAADAIYKNDFTDEFNDLCVVTRCIRKLQRSNKFNSNIFLDYVISEFVAVPLEIVWWLHKNDIIYFIQYCEIAKPRNICDTLLNFIAHKKQHNFFIRDEIIKDLLEELFRCTCRSKAGIYRLPRSKIWESYCLEMLNYILDKMTDVLFQENSKDFRSFIQYMPTLNRKLPSILLQQFLKTALSKIILHRVSDLDEYYAYTYQQLWYSENINKTLYKVYEQIFSKYCNMEDIMDIIKINDDRVNWKYTLAAVGLCTKISPSGAKILKDTTSTLLDISLKGGKFKQFLKCMLFIRQGCMETNIKMDYQTWYSWTFGTKSDFKNKYNATVFEFLTTSLITLIPYEPKTYLQIQINQALDAPPKCNSLIHHYKGLCKNRLQELETSPTIVIDNCTVTLLHLIEESLRNGTLSSTLSKIIDDESLRAVILQEISKPKIPYAAIKEMIVSAKHLSADEMNSVTACTNDDILVFD